MAFLHKKTRTRRAVGEKKPAGGRAVGEKKPAGGRAVGEKKPVFTGWVFGAQLPRLIYLQPDFVFWLRNLGRATLTLRGKN